MAKVEISCQEKGWVHKKNFRNFQAPLKRLLGTFDF